MADKETVVVENNGETRERRSSNGWIGLVIALLLVALFFMFGGFNMFGGAGTGDSTTSPVTNPTGGSTTTTP
jgi:hypothetical protein